MQHVEERARRFLIRRFRRARVVERGVRQRACCLPIEALYQPSLWPGGRGPSTPYTDYTMPLNMLIYAMHA